jgi:hypothetical protein
MVKINQTHFSSSNGISDCRPNTGGTPVPPLEYKLLRINRMPSRTGSLSTTEHNHLLDVNDNGKVQALLLFQGGRRPCPLPVSL